MQITIRLATVDDIDALTMLIHELAGFEKTSPLDKVALAENLKKFGFSDAPYFNCQLALADNIPVGYALYYFPFSAVMGQPKLFLEDLYVKQSHRRKKISFRLMQKLAQIALSKDCCALEWDCYKWNTGAMAFYDYIGGSVSDKRNNLKLGKDKLMRLAND